METALISSLKEDYGLTLKVEDLSVSFFNNWPNASIRLKNIYVANELDSLKSKPLLTASSLALSLDILKLLQKQFIIESVAIKNAEINLIKNPDGTKNFEFKKKEKKDEAQPLKFEVSKISLQNLQFNFTDAEKEQKINILFEDDLIRLKHAVDGFEAGIKGNIKVGGLLFKEKKGAFLKNADVNLNLSVSVFSKSKLIFIHPPSSVTIGNHPFSIASFIELNDKQQLMLSIQSDNIDYNKGIDMLNTSMQKMLANFTVSKPINAKILVITKLNVKQDPVLIVNLSGHDNNITVGHSKIPYSGVSFEGSIVSLDRSHTQGNTETAKIVFRNIMGKIYDFPFTASVTVTNFDEPQMAINANLLIDAAKINFKPGKDFILKGKCVANVSYSGPAKKLNKKEFLDSPMKLNAAMFFNSLSYQEINKPYIYTIEGNANVINKDLQFENLFLKTDAGNVGLKGLVKGFTTYVLGYSNGFQTTLVAKSESFNLNPYLMIGESKEKSEKNSDAAKQTIQDEQSNFEFDVSLAAKKLFVRHVKATNASINFVYKNKLLNLKSVNANACKGNLFAKGTIYDLNKISGELKIENMDVNEVFTEFENFGQKTIESKNLQGNIFIDAKLKAELDEKMEIIGTTMDGEVKVKLKEGHLLNFEPVQNVSDYIFKNRDFNDIAFSEINETCRIKGFEMEIEEMEIGSNVLNLFVSGKYNFKETSNINILIPWSNLKKRGKDYVPKNSGQTAENSKGLKLNYSGTKQKSKLSLGHK